MNLRLENRVWKSLIIFLVLLGVDRWSKFWVLRGFNNKIITSFLSFDVTMNRGIAWGLFHTESTGGFLIVTTVIFVIICAMLWYAWRQLCLGGLAIEEVLILAGAISNLIDRLVYSGVIDFIHFHLSSWSFPIFNLADVFIVIGVLWVMCTRYEK
jgi:signal peptidase II